MEKHSPGPWRRKQDGQIVDANGDDVCFRGTTTLCSGSEQALAEAEANTDLVISAPELLAVLKDVHDFLKRSGYDTGLVRAAIAKAEGGAS